LAVVIGNSGKHQRRALPGDQNRGAGGEQLDEGIVDTLVSGQPRTVVTLVATPRSNAHIRAHLATISENDKAFSFLPDD